MENFTETYLIQFDENVEPKQDYDGIKIIKYEHSNNIVLHMNGEPIDIDYTHPKIIQYIIRNLTYTAIRNNDRKIYHMFKKKIREQQSKREEKTREKDRNRKAGKVMCEKCNKLVRTDNMGRHKKSKKHQNGCAGLIHKEEEEREQAKWDRYNKRKLTR